MKGEERRGPCKKKVSTIIRVAVVRAAGWGCRSRHVAFVASVASVLDGGASRRPGGVPVVRIVVVVVAVEDVRAGVVLVAVVVGVVPAPVRRPDPLPGVAFVVVADAVVA